MYAIATLVMNGNSYIPAAITLAKSLRRHVPHSDVELICMVTSDVTDVNKLIPYYHHIYTVDRITAKDTPELGGPSASYIYHWISDAPTKWNIFAFDQYEKVLFLDSDMIVLSDIYNLFNLDCPAAMFDHQSAREYAQNPLWTGDRDKGTGFINWYKIVLKMETLHSHTITPLKTGTKIPRICLDNLRLYSKSQFAIHGGIALIKPDRRLLDLFKSQLQNIVYSLMMPSSDRYSRNKIYVPTDKVLSSIDEIALSLFMHDLGYTWTHIGMEYNVAAFHTYSIFRENTKILHYVGCYKPWATKMNGRTEREYVSFMAENSDKHQYKMHSEAVELWWKMYEDTQISSL